jgi:dephospho-CoA kinase
VKENYVYENGTFAAQFDEDGNIVHSDKFRALTHNNEVELRCISNYTPEVLKDLINTWFDNKKTKIPAIIEDFWDDCFLYIREDQVELLKAFIKL